MTRPNPPPNSVGDYALKYKIATPQLLLCGVEKAQPELNRNRPVVKLPPWFFNNVQGMTMEGAIKRFQDLSADLLTSLKRQQEEEAPTPVMKALGEKVAREQVFVKFKETPSSLQIHVKKIVTVDPARKQEPKTPPRSPSTK